MSGPPRGFQIRADNVVRRRLLRVEADTHQQAADSAAATLYKRQFALRMTTWNGRDGVFAALAETGEEKERFFVEAEDGTGRIKAQPSTPPTMTNEDAKKLQDRSAVPAAQTTERRGRDGKHNGRR